MGGGRAVVERTSLSRFEMDKGVVCFSDVVIQLKYSKLRGMSMGASVVVQARIDEDIKREATEVLDGLGLSVSDVVRMVLTKTARDKALPIGLTSSPFPPPGDQDVYDAWFRVKVQEALDDPRPSISNDEAKRRMAAHRAKAWARRNA